MKDDSGCLIMKRELGFLERTSTVYWRRGVIFRNFRPPCLIVKEDVALGDIQITWLYENMFHV
jgi:hypothetical protein